MTEDGVVPETWSGPGLRISSLCLSSRDSSAMLPWELEMLLVLSTCFPHRFGHSHPRHLLISFLNVLGGQNSSIKRTDLCP